MMYIDRSPRMVVAYWLNPLTKLQQELCLTQLMNVEHMRDLSRESGAGQGLNSPRNLYNNLGKLWEGEAIGVIVLGLYSAAKALTYLEASVLVSTQQLLSTSTEVP